MASNLSRPQCVNVHVHVSWQVLSCGAPEIQQIERVAADVISQSNFWMIYLEYCHHLKKTAWYAETSTCLWWYDGFTVLQPFQSIIAWFLAGWTQGAFATMFWYANFLHTVPTMSVSAWFSKHNFMIKNTIICMHRVSVMAKYIHDVKGKVRLKLVSIVATIRQNVLYLIQAL